MRRWLTGAALGLALAVSGRGRRPAEEGRPAAQDGRAEDAGRADFKAIKKEVSDASAEVSKAIRPPQGRGGQGGQRGDPEGVRGVREEADRGHRRAIELAKKDPKSEVATEALAWAVQGLRGKPDAIKEVVGLLKEHHLDSPKIRSAISAVPVRRTAERTGRRLPDRRGREEPRQGDEGDHPDGPRGDVQDQGRAVRPTGPEGRRGVDEEGRGDFRAGRRGVRRRQGPRRDHFGEQAKGELFELRHLAVGKAAPEIEGEDIDGAKFKLSRLPREGGAARLLGALVRPVPGHVPARAVAREEARRTSRSP